MESEADSPSLPQLHDDVILEIFKFLSLPERKNTRLVCRQWHRVSNRRIFAEREAFYITNTYQIRSVVEVLVKCERKILNLKFDHRTFGSSSNILWKKCSPRIQSLLFYKCQSSSAVVNRIFGSCKNLNKFSFQGSIIYESTEESLSHQKSILQLNDSVVRPKLRTLHFQLEDLSFRAHDLSLIASAFPQLKSLKISLFSSEKLADRTFSNFTVLLNVLGCGLKNLEELDVRFTILPQLEPTDLTDVPLFNLCRLKNVSMSLEPFILSGNSLTKILNYKFWRSLRVCWCSPYEPGMTVVIRLLNENPLLEKLDLFFTFDAADEFCELFKALVKSRLKSLKIETADYRWQLESGKEFIADVTASLEGLQCNDTVEKLSIKSQRTAEFSSLFVKYFRNIRDLNADPGNVNTIFKYQTNLKKLKITPVGAIRTDEPPPRACIESLELIDCQPLALDVFTTYQFPNLKYLIINESSIYYDRARQYDGGEELFGPVNLNVNEENDDNATNQNDSTDTVIFIRKMNSLMSSIFRKSPHLEAIQFGSDYRLNMEALNVFFQSCLHFHQLRYVSCCSYTLEIDELALKREVVKYFKKSPSFRGLWLKTMRFGLAFFFNTVTKKYEFFKEDCWNHDFLPVHNLWLYRR